jgi:hypothetical protein
MRKNIIFGMSILSVFILCSLSYQPIIADTPIETITQVKKSKASDLDVDELKELYTKLLEFKSQSNDDCGCEETTEWRFPVICTILGGIFLIGLFLWVWTGVGDNLVMSLQIIGDILGCPWA